MASVDRAGPLRDMPYEGRSRLSFSKLSRGIRPFATLTDTTAAHTCRLRLTTPTILH